MKKVIRKLSASGGITLPADLRREYAFAKGDKICLEEKENGTFTIKKVDGLCMFCESYENLVEHEGRFICKTCLAKLQEKKEA